MSYSYVRIYIYIYIVRVASACFAFFYHPVYNFNWRVRANRVQWGTRFIHNNLYSAGVWILRTGWTGGWTITCPRRLLYMRTYSSCVSTARVLECGADGERGKRIIWRGGGGNFLRVGRCCRHGPVFSIWWSPPQGVIDRIIILISYITVLYAHAVTTK